MTRKDEKILSASYELFARYGIGRTTMADIAQAAGVARQTLYNTYPNKNEVLRAVIQTSVNESLRAVKTAWEILPDIETKIDAYMEHGPIAWFDAVQNAPDAAELFDGINNVAKAEVAEGMAQWVAMFRDLFAEAGIADPEALADFFVFSSKNAKYDVPDRASYLRRLDTLKAATLSVIA